MSSAGFLHRNFIRNVYGIFRKSTSLQDISSRRLYTDSVRLNASDKETKSKEEYNVGNMYINPIIKYYQDKKRYLNSKLLENGISETFDSRSLLNSDNVSLKNALKTAGHFPFKDDKEKLNFEQKSILEDDMVSLNNCLVECRNEDCTSLVGDNISIRNALHKETEKKSVRKFNTDDTRSLTFSLNNNQRDLELNKSFKYNVSNQQDDKSLKLSIKDILSRKPTKSSKFKLNAFQNEGDNISLSISLRSYKNGSIPPNTVVTKNVDNKATSKKLVKDRILKRNLLQRSASESDLLSKIKNHSFKIPADTVSRTVSLQSTIEKSQNFVSRSQPVNSSNKAVKATFSTKDLLKRIPLPDTNTQDKSCFITGTPKKSGKKGVPKVYPWTLSPEKHSKYLENIFTPKSVTNITKHIITKKTKPEKKSQEDENKLKKKTGIQLFQYLTSGAAKKEGDDKREKVAVNVDKLKGGHSTSFLDKIMSMYKSKKIV